MRFLVSVLGVVLFPVAAHAAEPYQPTTRQLAALCDTCAVVTSVDTEKRKGKASGVGAVGGAVAGGVVGNRMGDSTVATVGGAALGGLLGNEIEKRVKKHTVWVVTATQRDGASKRYELDKDPKVKAGDVVIADGAGLRKK